MQTINSKWKDSVAYVWSHFALSSIQKGVQSSHCITDLTRLTEKNPIAKQWADYDKTVKFLDGGNTEKLMETKDLLFDFFEESNIPWARFAEDYATLGGILTSVGVILPGDVIKELDRFKEDPDASKRVLHLLVKDYKIGKVKLSQVKKLIDLLTKSRWAS